MNKEQQRVIQSMGYTIQAVPGLRTQPRAKYYSRNKTDGHIVEHNLPADPYSLAHYLEKGFTLNPQDSTTQVQQNDTPLERGDILRMEGYSVMLGMGLLA